MGLRTQHGDLPGVFLGPEPGCGTRAGQPPAHDDYPLDLHEHQG
jgi:hypothetical protein